MGLYSGWLIGMSNTPVVGAALPLVFGLVAALSLPALDRFTGAMSLRTELARIEKEDGIPVGSELIQRVQQSADYKAEAIKIWAICIMLFCVASHFGAKKGIRERQRGIAVRHLRSTAIQHPVLASLNSEDVASVYNFVLQCQLWRISDQERDACIKDILDRAEKETVDHQSSKVDEALNKVFRDLDTKGRTDASASGLMGD